MKEKLMKFLKNKNFSYIILTLIIAVCFYILGGMMGAQEMKKQILYNNYVISKKFIPLQVLPVQYEGHKFLLYLQYDGVRVCHSPECELHNNKTQNNE